MGFLKTLLEEGALEVEKESPSKVEVSEELVADDIKVKIDFPTAIILKWGNEYSTYPLYCKKYCIVPEWEESIDYSIYDKVFYNMSKVFHSMWSSWLEKVIEYRLKEKITEEFLLKSFALYWKSYASIITSYCPITKCNSEIHIDEALYAISAMPPALVDYLPGFVAQGNILDELASSKTIKPITFK